MYNYLYQKGDVNYCIIHSLDGYDEISLTGAFKALSISAERMVTPQDLGLPELQPSELAGTGDIPGTSAIFMKVLTGQGTEAQNAVVIANAAMSLSTYFPHKEMSQCNEDARSALLGGKALKVFNQLIYLQ
jgi:anthranilate phosphoribosyltransferase